MAHQSSPIPATDWQSFVCSIEGWLSDSEGNALYRLAKRCSGKGVIVEIGSWKGRSTIWLAKGSEAGSCTQVYAIDPHTGITAESNGGTQSTLQDFLDNLHFAAAEKFVVPIVSTSSDAAANFDKAVELLFIDGSHHEELVQNDFDLWFPKVVDGGVIAFHDTILWKGPKRVARRMMFRSPHFRDAHFTHSLSYATKVRRATLQDRLKSEIVLLIKALYEALFLLNKRFPIAKYAPWRSRNP